VLPHAVPIIVVLSATAAFALIASAGWPGGGTMIRLLGAMLGGQLAIGAVNDLVDAEIDALAKPNKPIPAGLVTPRGARIVTLGGIGTMVALGQTFGAGSFLLLVLGTATGIAYSLWFKRTTWSWIPYLIALPLLPIWVWASLGTVDRAFLAIYPIGAPAVLAVQIAQSLPDVEADRATGVWTIAAVLGESRSIVVAWGGLVGAAVLAIGFAPWLLDRMTWVALATIVVVGLVIANVLLWRVNRRRGVMSCFPFVAIGVVVLGLSWAASLVGI
jgi:4-hydroxybenzoate polyprenyltransferase